MKEKKYLVVGAGFSGAVIAEQLSQRDGVKVVVIDSRHHIGGNCYTKRCDKTDVMVHEYGPHIFHTNDLNVWNYIERFCHMEPYINRVKAIYSGEVYSMPINLHTINQFFRKSFSPREAFLHVEKLGDTSKIEPQNFEEQAIKMLGSELYYAFFYAYTKKQWGCDPKELPAAILKRLPVRFNYNDNYYNSNYQGIPRDGYTAIFERMLDKPNIELRLNTKFDSGLFDCDDYEHIFYTGSIDEFFHYKYGRLGYRTVYFEKDYMMGDFQGNAVINYCDLSEPYTRIHEHKYFTPWEDHKETVFLKEFSKETGVGDIPFYPKRLEGDLLKLQQYQNDVKKLEKYTFLGRLATYRYMDMHHVISEALHIVGSIKK